MLILKDAVSYSKDDWQQSSGKVHPQQLTETQDFNDLQFCSILAHDSREQEKSERLSCPSHSCRPHALAYSF